MVMLILLVWRIGFGVTGMEFVGVMPMVQGFVRCDAGSLWLVIIPKSKDVMAEPWDGVGKAAMAGTHKAQEGASGWVRCSHRW
jgi:hypothetical protein